MSDLGYKTDKILEQLHKDGLLTDNNVNKQRPFWIQVIYELDKYEVLDNLESAISYEILPISDEDRGKIFRTSARMLFKAIENQAKES